ncbi:MAG: hypothetical protein P4L85_16995 [Paludisphaera borealis]|uniref:hypothetical protein n=1 Tax=Paludisphaera borealis TaxID=1387353 RepID=UPI00283EAE33|nr:hypothetical protein [Paludisphaera borealis]MDR3621051.1 hypothetical protein [Paludisphaera borealis]
MTTIEPNPPGGESGRRKPRLMAIDDRNDDDQTQFARAGARGRRRPTIDMPTIEPNPPRAARGRAAADDDRYADDRTQSAGRREPLVALDRRPSIGGRRPPYGIASKGFTQSEHRSPPPSTGRRKGTLDDQKRRRSNPIRWTADVGRNVEFIKNGDDRTQAAERRRGTVDDRR